MSFDPVSYVMGQQAGGGGGGVTVEPLSVTENGTYSASGKAYSPVTVDVQPQQSELAKDVNLIDYDGTILHSFTAAEFAALDALPENPTYERLTALGWNWSIADAKEYVAKYGHLTIGQMQKSSDGKTRIYAYLNIGSPYLGIAVNGEVSVDWGDGSAAESITGSSIDTLIYTPHTYAAVGEYCIAITVVNGEFSIVGDTVSGSNKTCSLLCSTYNPRVAADPYVYRIQRIELGDNVSLGNNGLNNAQGLLSITSMSKLLQGMTNYQNASLKSAVIGPLESAMQINTTFSTCRALHLVSLPSNALSCPSLNGCWTLLSVDVPDGATEFPASMLEGVLLLTSIDIPETVTKINSSALKNLSFARQIKFFGSNPPLVTNANAFMGLPTDCTIYVPEGSLNAYKTKTNYPDPAVYTYAGY